MKIAKIIKWLFLIYIIVEVLLFIIVAKFFGIFITLLLLIATTACGFSLLKQQGMKSVEWQMQMFQSGSFQHMQSMPELWRTLAGLLLIFPGFLTDLIGGLLFIPFIRKILVKRFKMNTHAANQSHIHPDTKETYEGEYEEKPASTLEHKDHAKHKAHIDPNKRDDDHQTDE